MKYLVVLWIIGGILFGASLLNAQAATTDFYGNEAALVNDIVLTIDDCSIEANIRPILDLLKDKGVTATFFPIMRHMKVQDPQLWRDLVAAGHEIGYHTMTHATGLTQAQLPEDFAIFQENVRQILQKPDYTIRYVRPPGGLWNNDWNTWVAQAGVITVRWNFTVPDSTLPYIQGVLSNRTRGGSIVIMHTDKADLDWLSNNIDLLMALKDSSNQAYHITSLTNALND